MVDVLMPTPITQSTRKSVRIVLAGFLTGLILTSLAGIITLIIGEFGEIQGKTLMNTASIAVFSIGVLPSLLHFERKQYRTLSSLGITISTLALFNVILIVWIPGATNAMYYTKSLASILIGAVAINHAGVILLIPLAERFSKIYARATLLSIAMVAIFLLIGIWFEINHEAYWRFFGTLVILDILGTIGTPILALLTRRTRTS